MNARFYNPTTGRFVSQDSYSGNPYDPWTQHLYTYCGNNPTNMVDPTGHFPVLATVGVVALLVSTLFLSGCSKEEDTPTFTAPTPAPQPSAVRPSSTPKPSPTPKPSSTPTPSPTPPTPSAPSTRSPKEKYSLDESEIEALCTIAGEVDLFEDSSDAYRVLAWTMRNRRAIKPSYYGNTWFEIVNKERQYKGHSNEPFGQMKAYLDGNLTGYYARKGIPDIFTSIVDTALPILRGEVNDDPTHGATSANRGRKGHEALDWRGPLGNWYYGNDPNIDGKKGVKWGW